MSDNEDGPIENPDPESDIVPDLTAEADAQPEAEADSVVQDPVVQGDVEHDAVAGNEEQSAERQLHQEAGNRDTETEETVNGGDSGASNFDDSLAEGDQNRNWPDQQNQQNLLAEGDQILENHNNSGDNREIVEEVEELNFGQNASAAEDEQYFHNSVGIDFSGAEWSLEPEGCVPSQSCANGESSNGAEFDLNRCSVDASSRTESSHHHGCGSGAYNENNVAEELLGTESETAEAEGAVTVANGPESVPEAQAHQNPLVVEDDLNGVSGGPEENEPTESDQDLSYSVNDADRVRMNDRTDSSDLSGAVSSVGAGIADRNIEPVEDNENPNYQEGAVAGVNTESSENAEKPVPEDELSVFESPESKTGDTSESFQPECDQSAMQDVPNESSPIVETALLDSSIVTATQADCTEVTSVNADVDDHSTLSNVSPTNSQSVQPLETQEHSQSAGKLISSDETQCAMQRNCSEQNTGIGDLNPAITSDTGAIPKYKPKPPDIQSKTDDKECAKGPTSQGLNVDSAMEKNIDSEDELLSELDATLQGVPECTVKEENKSSYSQVKENGDKLDSHLACDQCQKNKLQCSLSKSPHLKGSASKSETSDLKKQLYQANQLLMERECEINRLKGDIEEERLKLSTVTLERDSYQKDVECLKHQNSDDLYIPQIKELEYTIAQQQNEVRGLKDKLSSHGSAAKRAIATLQNEMKLRVDQITKRCEEAVREKDMMVVKFAQAEHKNLECQKQAERAESKLRDMEKERDVFLGKMKAVKEQRSKMGAELEAKMVETSSLHKELDKHRELVSSGDVRVKWAQNKLKAELEAHKDTKVQLEKMTIKLKEAKEETQQIRHDCQAIIRTYQESEEVKSNSLDKELKLKETELLEHQLQKNSFELAHVKTQRELEQVKGELIDSKSECRSLKERISSMEADHEQLSGTASKYTEIIQRQKREVQELRERVETLVQVKSDFTRAQELIKTLDSEISELKISNKDLVAEMEACRKRETDKLELTEKLSVKNADLQSENTTLSNKVLNLTGELQATKMEYQDVDTKLKNIADALANEQKLREEETRELKTKLAGKCKAVEDLTRKVDEEKDEIKTLKRKHANNVKDLTRQLQQVRRKLENHEASTNGDKDTVSMGSRTSSNGSLNTINIADQTQAQVVQPSTGGVTGPAGNTVQRNTSPEQEYPVITEQVEVDKQVLIERIVRLQRALARKNEKIEFMEDHINQLIDEIQKKNKIIQSYVLKEESGTMTSDFRDKAKGEIAKKHSIMGSVYSSHSNDGTMTLDLSLEINRKLQAVLEDTLLKNMTLKESLDTLGQEIARLSQENRKLQLQQQGKSRIRGNPNYR